MMNIKKGLILLVIILMIFAIPLGVYLVKQRQEIRKKASTPTGTATVSLSPASDNYEVGQSFPVSVYFNPVSIPISSIAVRITYQFSGASPKVVASSLEINPSLLGTGDWMCPVKTITPVGNQVQIDIACANVTTDGFTAVSDTLLASFNLVANEVPTVNPVVLRFDPQESKIQSKIDNTDILLTPTATASYTIATDFTPPETITDLNVSDQTSQSLTLSWTAPVDNGPNGKASAYDLRYSLSPINTSNWSSANQVAGLPDPANPDISEAFTVSNLNHTTTYYFAIKSKDAANNISDLSNIADATTTTSTFSFGFKMQGINQRSILKSMEVTLKGRSTKIYPNLSFRSNINGVFNPINPIPLTNLSIPDGGVTVDVLVKDNSHLRKKLGSITLMPNDNIAPSSWNSVVVKAGDFNNDNQLDIDDVGAIIGVYTVLSVPANEGNQQFDINANSFIEIDDISGVLLNYTALTVLGDE